jgi:uncharacterized protein (TIGR02301 family)
MSKSCRNSARAYLCALAVAFLLLPAAPAANAQDTTEDAPAPQAEEDVAPAYEEQLERLSEVVGSLHFLRQLCEGNEAEEWREAMARLLAAEEPSPLRRRKFVGLFNQGYRSFGTVYTRCTPQARRATERFLLEGQQLSDGIVSRYGN